MLNHWSTVCGPLCGSPIKKGRLLPPVLDRSVLVVTVNGDPDWKVKMPLVCQPEMRAFTTRSVFAPKVLPLPNGSSYTRLVTKRWRTSNDDVPVFPRMLLTS